MRNLENRKIIVLGGSGFLGKAVCRALDSRKSTVFIADSKSCNLLNLESSSLKFCRIDKTSFVSLQIVTMYGHANSFLLLGNSKSTCISNKVKRASFV